MALQEAPHPVVIALDDIDRLPPEHVRQVFDVIAQTAGMEKLGYLLAFDRAVVEPQLPPGLL
jgi:predicted KAP-like P-loop ATPase